MLVRPHFMDREGIDVEHMLVLAKVLWQSIIDCSDEGIPLVEAHDNHRLAGWSYPRSLLFGSTGVEMWGDVHFPETEAEEQELRVRAVRFREETTARRTEDGRDALLGLVGEHIRGEAQVLWHGTTCLVNQGLARRVAPELFHQADPKSGLIPLRVLQSVGPGIYEARNGLLVFAHPLLRREGSRHNTLNVELLEQLQGLSREPDLTTLAIRLDPDMVGLAGSVSRSVERVYWSGPLFTNDLTSIPPGITVHGPPPDEVNGLMSKTEFRWKSRKGQHILECEEVRDRPTSWSEEGWPCRYVHSIVNEDTGIIEHLDGAVRLWDDEGMVTRCVCKISEVDRRSDYQKLWRVDGRLSLDRWKELIYLHFRGNPAVAEYLGTQEDHHRATTPTPSCDASSSGDLKMLLTRRQVSGSVAIYRGLRVRWDPTAKASRSALAVLSELGHDEPDGAGAPVFIAEDAEGITLLARLVVESLERESPTVGQALNMAARLDSEHEAKLGLVGQTGQLLNWMRREEWFPPVWNSTTLDRWFDEARLACVGGSTESIIISPLWTVSV